MADQAHVTSVEALEAFRASLVLYLSKARPTIEEVASDLMRLKQWLQNDQRTFWETQMKVRARELERCQSELLGARMSKLRDATGTQEMALHRAQRAVREADDKIRVLRKWDRELDNRSEPLLKQIEQLHGYLTTEMVKAQALLGEYIKSLQAYAETAPSVPRPKSAPANAEAAAETGVAATAGDPGGQEGGAA